MEKIKNNNFGFLNTRGLACYVVTGGPVVTMGAFGPLCGLQLPNPKILAFQKKSNK
jgi:hypothetical protein